MGVNKSNYLFGCFEGIGGFVEKNHSTNVQQVIKAHYTVPKMSVCAHVGLLNENLSRMPELLVTLNGRCTLIL